MIYDNLLNTPGVTYTRAGIASATNAVGAVESFAANIPRRNTQGILLDMARTNYVRQSQTLTAAEWIQENTVRTADHAIAPDGTMTADRLQFSGAAYISSSFAAGLPANTLITVSFWAKGVSSSQVIAYRSGASSITRLFTLTTSWQRFTFTYASASSTEVFQLVNQGFATGADVICDFHVWGLQGELGAVATSYITTTGSAATTAADSLIFVKALQVSSDFTISGEVSFTAPAGTHTALHEHDGTANNGFAIIRNVNGVLYLVVYKDGALVAAFTGVSKPGAVSVKWAISRIAGVFTLYVDGAVIESIATTQFTQFTTSTLGNELAGTQPLAGYLKSYNFSTFGVTTAQGIALTQSSSANITVPAYEALIRPDLNDVIETSKVIDFMNSGIELLFTTGYYRKGLQTTTSMLSLSGATYTRAGAATAETAAGAIINFAANVPRITDKGVLIEEARTNLLLRSQEFDNASWTKVGSTITPNTTTAPDGTLTAETLIESTDTSSHDVSQSQSLAAVQHTFSAFLKANGRSWVRLFCFQPGNPGLGVWFNVASGTIGTVGAGASNARIIPLANGWYRCSFTFTALAAAASSYIQIATGDNATSTYTGDGTSGAFIWGAQLEAGAFPTSYIPTTGAAATRAADVMLLSSATSGARSLVAIGEYAGAGSDVSANNRVLAGLRGTGNNQIILYNRLGGTGAYVETATVGESFPLIAGTVAPGVVFESAISVAANDVRLAKDAVLGTPDTSATIPATTSLGVGCLPTGSFLLNGYVRSIVYFPFTLNDNQLQVQSNLPSAPQVDEALRPSELATVLDRGALYGITGDTTFRDSGVEALFQTPYYRKGLLFGTSHNAISMTFSRSDGVTATNLAGEVVTFPTRRNLLIGSTLQGGANQPTWWNASLNTGTSRGPVSSTRGAPGAWQASATNGREFFSQTVTLAANTTYTVSVLVESVSGSTAVLSYGTNLPAGATSGSIISPSTPGLYTYRIVVGAAAGTAEIRLGIGCSANNSGACTVRLSSVQLEQGIMATAFIPTTAVAVTGSSIPRTTDRGILVEEARTNLLLRSQEFDNAAWTQSRMTVTANAGLAPDGTMTADLLSETVDTGTHRVFQTLVKAASSVGYAASVFVKANGRNFAQIRISGTGENPAVSVAVNLLTGDLSSTYLSGVGWTVNSASSVVLSNGWVKVSLVGVSDASSNVSFFVMSADSIAAVTPSMVGSNVAALLVWGAQLELGATPSSYIPTGAASATRAQDSLPSPASIASGQNFLVNTEVEFTRAGTAQQRIFELDAGTAANRIVLYRLSTGEIEMVVTVASASTVISGPAKAGARTCKIAVRRVGSVYQLIVDGVVSTPGTVAAMPTLTSMFDGSGRTLSPLNDYLRRRVTMLGTFTDAQCIALTT